MKAFVLGLLVGLTGTVAYAQNAPVVEIPAVGRVVSDFIPARYDTLAGGRATGDLNHDGLPDVALALHAAVEDTISYPDDTLPPRQLVILFGTPTGYTLAAHSTKAILCRGCGGMNRDPFQGMSIEKGVLLLHHYSSSNWHWSITAKFRYRADGFYLIGQTNSYGTNGGNCDGQNWPPGCDYHDVNFVSGEYETIKVSEACKLMLHKRGKNKPMPLRKLVDYQVEA